MEMRKTGFLSTIIHVLLLKGKTPLEWRCNSSFFVNERIKHQTWYLPLNLSFFSCNQYLYDNSETVTGLRCTIHFSWVTMNLSVKSQYSWYNNYNQANSREVQRTTWSMTLLRRSHETFLILLIGQFSGISFSTWGVQKSSHGLFNLLMTARKHSFVSTVSYYNPFQLIQALNFVVWCLHCPSFSLLLAYKC